MSARAFGQADSPPSPTDAMQTFRAAENWVRTWRVPPEAEALPVAASVTLRLDGAVIGRGQETTPGPRAVATAVTQAITEATARLPIERDALYDENLRAAAARMAISLEFAGPFVPITPESWEAAALELAFGLDGVAARLGERTAAIFPGTMLTASGGGMDPGRALAACVSKVSDDPTLILQKPGEIAKNHGAVFYRFRTIHLAQRSPNAAPDFLHRGGRVVDTRELTEAELRRWADELADSLTRRRWPGAEKHGLQGTYDPITGRHETPAANPLQQGLALLALQTYWTQHQNTPRGDEISSAMTRLFSDLATVEPGETAPWDSPAAAALLAGVFSGAALGERWRADGSVVFQEPAARCRSALDAAINAEGAFAESVAPDERPMVVCGLMMSSELAPHAEYPALARRVRAGVQSIYSDTPPGELVARMPWLGTADLGAVELEHWPEEGPHELPSAVALREMRRLVWEHQLRPESLAFDQRDLAGGIVFTAARHPLPSWQSARPLAFIATMLGDPRLTDDKEVPGELARLLASLRFLRQLTADDAEGWMYADPSRARGGVRVSLWDQRMPIEATAMTLMTVCETLRSLDAITKRRAAAPPAP